MYIYRRTNLTIAIIINATIDINHMKFYWLSEFSSLKRLVDWTHLATQISHWNFEHFHENQRAPKVIWINATINISLSGFTVLTIRKMLLAVNFLCKSVVNGFKMFLSC